MDLYFTIVSFIFGTILGSFYNVVGYRLPRGESIIYPSSHCPNCNHKLGPSELIPILSYLLQKGKCKKCKKSISLFYPFFELLSGVLFAISYIVFKPSIDLAIALIFISMSLIIIISDYQTMTIPDEVLIVSIILLLICIFIKGGFSGIANSIINGIIAFTFMFILKKFGDILFKKESMGGGDIKLMFIFGLILGYKIAILTIFLASIIALPIALIIIIKDQKLNNDPDVPETALPFGPFLVISAILFLLTKFDFNLILNILIK